MNRPCAPEGIPKRHGKRTAKSNSLENLVILLHRIKLLDFEWRKSKPAEQGSSHELKNQHDDDVVCLSVVNVGKETSEHRCLKTYTHYHYKYTEYFL